MSAETDKISRAGDVIIDEVLIISYKGFAQTINPQVIGMEIYEDLFSSFITGKIFVRDSQELSNLIPLVGEERVRIRIRTPSLPDKYTLDKEFAIYKMDDRHPMADREMVYVLHFISKEAIVDMNKHISKAYQGKISSIVEELITTVNGLESQTNYSIEETKNDTKFISNWWRPVQCIQYAADFAVNQNNSPSYLFYENKNGLNFISLEALYTGAPVIQKFIQDNMVRPVNATTGTVEQQIDLDYQRILNLDVSDHFNYMERLQSGMYGSELVSYDMLTKQYTHVGYHPEDDTDSFRLNEFPAWSDNAPARPKANVLYVPKYFNNFNGFGDVTNARIIQKRKSVLAQLSACKVKITVFGRMDYTVGQIVVLSIPKKTQIKGSDIDVEDKLLSGNYIISALCHYITGSSHECVMELSKDSFGVNLNDMGQS